MNIKEQVCSLELSKQLKKLGIKQKSQFYWAKLSPGNYLGKTYSLIFEDNVKMDNIIISAFTVAELGEMLPVDVATQKKDVITDKKKIKNQWCALYIKKDKETFEYAQTEADARAKMLIYLTENKLI